MPDDEKVRPDRRRGNPDNIRRLNERSTQEERKEAARRAGLASGEARRTRRDARATLEALLAGTVTMDGEKISRLDAVCLAQIEQAMNGDTKAFSAILDRMEGKPVEHVETKMHVDDLLTKEQRDAAVRAAMLSMPGDDLSD